MDGVRQRRLVGLGRAGASNVRDGRNAREAIPLEAAAQVAGRPSATTMPRLAAGDEVPSCLAAQAVLTRPEGVGLRLLGPIAALEARDATTPVVTKPFETTGLASTRTSLASGQTQDEEPVVVSLDGPTT